MLKITASGKPQQPHQRGQWLTRGKRLITFFLKQLRASNKRSFFAFWRRKQRTEKTTPGEQLLPSNNPRSLPHLAWTFVCKRPLLRSQQLAHVVELAIVFVTNEVVFLQERAMGKEVRRSQNFLQQNFSVTVRVFSMFFLLEVFI